MKTKKDTWNYIHEYRRYKGNLHQIKKDGKWETINFKLDVPPNSNTIS